VLVKDAMKDPDVAYAFVADTDGKILAQSDASATEGPMNRPKDLAPLKDELLIQTYVSAGRRVIDFAVPLVYSRVPVGALYLGFSRLYREEKPAEAITEWRAVLELEPEHASARRNIDQAERLLKALEERRKK